MAYSFERLNDENLKHLVPLYRKVFGKQADEAFVRQKYQTDYLGKKYLGYIAFDEDQIPVAFNGAIPFKISYNENIYFGAQFGDAMTLPQHTKKGLFTRCGELANELIRSEGIPIIYGFPNQNSHYGYFHHLKWQKLHVMHRYEMKLQSLPMSNVLNKAGLDIFRKKREDFFRKYGTDQVFQNSALEDGTSGTLRDKEFFKYKSFQGSRIVVLEDCKVWLKADKAILVGDIEQVTKDKFRQVIQALQRTATELGFNKITFQTSPDTFLDRQLSQILSPKPSWTAGFLDVGADFDLHKLRFTYGDLDTF